MSRRKSKFIVYGLLFLAAFLLLFVRPEVFRPFKFVVSNIVAIPIRIISSPLHELKKIISYHRTYEEYQFLKKEYLILKDRLSGFDEVQKENSRLARLLEFKRGLVYSSIAANVVGRDPDTWNSVIMIDRGQEDGIEIGMPVISAFGVVGKVLEAGASKSKVMLLTDPGFSVASLAKRSREVGMVSGSLSGICRMRYLSGDADVQVGDVILTSKLSAAFPEGLLVGEVVEAHTDDNSLAMFCLVKPAAELSQLEEVLVIQKR